MNNILAINPGSTSTKIGFFKNEEEIFEIIIRHSDGDLMKHQGRDEQLKFRKTEIEKILKDKKVDLKSLSAIACRGGVLKPINTGAYLVNEKMINDLKNSKIVHPSSYAAMIGKQIADQNGINAYIFDGVTTNELDPMVKITGFKEFSNNSAFQSHCQTVSKRTKKRL